MVSSVTWLDFSEAQQRAVRDVLRNFEDKGTVDDLGFGTIRDAISNGLFPGTSIIQTRARYFLFIPWIFMEAQRRWPQQMVGKASDMERKLIDALRTADDTDGLIGKAAGKDLKTLPSAIYWSGLQTFGIFKLRGKTVRQFGRMASREAVRSEFEGEVVDQGSSYWADLPPAPDEFFRFKSADLNLNRVEAEWLAERMISTSSNLRQPNLLSELVMKVRAKEVSVLDVEYVWDLKFDVSFTARNRDLLFHAERFSLLAHGLSLLYNEMLTELVRREQSDFDPGRDYVEALDEWSTDAQEIELLQWCRQLDDFWACLIGAGSLVSAGTRDFVRDVASFLLRDGLQGIQDNIDLRKAVIDRERVHKRSQARFHNKSRLRAYQGEAGTSRMVFRWDLVRRILRDIATGYETVSS